MRVSKSVASNLVKRMEKNGFIQIVPSRLDKRYKQVALTKLGLDKLEPLMSWHLEMAGTLFKGIPKEDFRSMIQMIERLKENIKEYKERKHV